ncbi:hypothetical protein VE01_04690 [Pseudogymnoascus verrucosus]|uniref:Cytochrome P450 n=1 Tax=Pseudogymnoascus verrucosus TaxID=342668 RepID=A0A1B8GNA5_9PEZI|nr:uncharacterized protein VE01_04690 [Pseudogymnoascus verrucosus]OBT97320.1 hypothetical protein VE01_04690 [Pseudogymnoascus verrucosus]
MTLNESAAAHAASFLYPHGFPTAPSPIKIITLAAVLIFTISFFVRGKKTKYSYPPGPKGNLVVGNTFQLDPRFPGAKFASWGQEYDDMFSIFLGSTRWVVVNSSKMVRELLDRKGKIYLSRPYFPVTQEILSGGMRIVLMPHSERWRNLRKIMHQLLTAKAADSYKPYQEIESRKLIWDYLKAPELFYLHGARFANSVIMSVVFGRRSSMSEANVKELFSCIDEFMKLQGSPSASFIDGFPFIARWLPVRLQWYRPKAEKVFHETLKVYENFFDDLQKRIDQGENPECFARSLVDLSKQYNFSDEQQYFCAGTIIEAGSDTTRNQINLMLAAAAKYPEWVKKARQELDSVLGDAKRLPDFDDWESLPYIRAVMKETLRWRPNMIASGVPRVLVEDDVVGPYRFEKGTVFTWNHYGISHDEQEYKNNQVFDPDRFLNEDLNDMLKGHWGFGMGRRVCVGWHVGSRNMFISFSRLLYCFDFAEDPSEPIDETRIDAFAHKAAPFKLNIKPRSQAHADLIERECRVAGEAVS